MIRFVPNCQRYLYFDRAITATHNLSMLISFYKNHKPASSLSYDYRPTVHQTKKNNSGLIVHKGKQITLPLWSGNYWLSVLKRDNSISTPTKVDLQSKETYINGKKANRMQQTNKWYNNSEYILNQTPCLSNNLFKQLDHYKSPGKMTVSSALNV